MSDFAIKTQNFMIIRGVKIADLRSIEDMFEEQICGINNTTKLITIYRANPPVFKDPMDWPQSSNCKCWHCHKFFEDTPWALPYDVKGPIDVEMPEFLVEGNFCSPNCALAYLNAETRGSQARECRKRLFCAFCRKMAPALQWPPTPTPKITQFAEYSGENGTIV